MNDYPRMLYRKAGSDAPEYHGLHCETMVADDADAEAAAIGENWRRTPAEAHGKEPEAVIPDTPEAKGLSDERDALAQEVEDLKADNDALGKKVEEAVAENDDLRRQIASLTKDRDEAAKERDELKAQVDELTKPAPTKKAEKA